MVNELKNIPARLQNNISWRYRSAVYKNKESRHEKAIKLSHVTCYAVGNVGDTVLSQCVRRVFEKSCGDIGWNIIDVRKPVTTRTIESINKTRALVIGGGGLFLPDTNGNSISGWQWAISEELLKAIKVPIIVYSVGYNYFPGQTPDETFIQNLSLLCEKAKFVGLRNHGSIEAVKSLVPKELMDKIVWQPCTTTLIRRIYGEKIDKKKDTRRVALNVAFDRAERRFGDSLDSICTEVAMAAKDIERMGYDIVAVSHCGEDARFLQYLSACGVKAEYKDLSMSFPDQVYQFYNQIDCVLGMRGHAQMIPFGLNCDIISLGTHDKMKWFLEDIDSTDWYINLIGNRGNLRDLIVKKFIKIHQDSYDETQKRLYKEQDMLWNVTQENMRRILSIIGGISNINGL